MAHNQIRKLVLTVVALGMAGSALAGAHIQIPGPDGGPREMRAMTRMAEKLNLTDNQKQDFAALMELYRPRFEEIVKRGKEDREALVTMAPDNPDYPATADRVSREAARSVGETVTLLAELQGLVFALLSPEQQVRFMDIRAEQQERMKRKQARKARNRRHMHKDHDCDHADGSCPHHGDN